MTKADFVNLVQKSGGISRLKACNVVNDFLFELQTRIRREEDIKCFPQLFTLRPKTTAARAARNPSTGETIAVPSKKAVKFKMSKFLKDMLN